MLVKKSILLFLAMSNGLGNVAYANSKKPFTHIIVGLGTAGAVLARFLSDDRKNNVLVLEAGQNRSNDPIVKQGAATIFSNFTALSYSPKYAFTRLVADFTNGVDLAEQLSSGRLWGGGSAHNFMALTRNEPKFWNDLAATAHDPEWSYKNLVSLFKKLEHFHPNGIIPNAAQRGLKGRHLQIIQNPPVFSSPFNQLASTALGVPIIPDYNVSEGVIGITAQQSYTDAITGERSFSISAFLPPTILTPEGKGIGRNLTVLSGSDVRRVLLNEKNDKAIGVEYVNNGKCHCVKACKEVILCAGAPFSAAILQYSGIGKEDVLKPQNIKTRVRLPRVGEGLKIQYGIIMGMTGTADSGVFAYVDGHPFFPAGNVAGDGVRRFQLTTVPALQALLPLDILSATNTVEAEGISGFAWNLRPRSVGTAFIIDPTSGTFPNVQYDLYSDGDVTDPDSDLSASVAMFKLFKEIADANGSTMVYPTPEAFADPSNQLLAAAAKGALVYSQLSGTYHYTGTCNIGTNPRNSVVDNKLRVHKVKNLRVADNSIYPSPGAAWSGYVVGAQCAKFLGAKIH